VRESSPSIDSGDGVNEDAPATAGIPAETDWIEVYDGDRLLSIRCARMSRYTASLEATGEVVWCDSLASLLALLDGFVSGRTLIVALGDSNTASARAWPRRLARMRAAAGDPAAGTVVVNIANIGETAEQGVLRLASLLARPALHAAAEVAVVYLGGVHNVARRSFALTHFFNGHLPDFALESERDLARLPAGRTMARLIHAVPDDEAGYDRWFARRAVAGVQAVAAAAVAAGATFYGILQPMCYPDLFPAYAAGLRLGHAAMAPERDFAAWLLDRPSPYRIDADAFFGVPMRPALDAQRALWPAAADAAIFVDWAGLFHDLDPNSHGTSCYSDSYDAIHYSDLGWHVLAAAVDLLVRARAPIIPPVLVG
jgi:hypothetical protein